MNLTEFLMTFPPLFVYHAAFMHLVLFAVLTSAYLVC
jgi:hypothetical protein